LGALNLGGKSNPNEKKLKRPDFPQGQLHRYFQDWLGEGKKGITPLSSGGRGGANWEITRVLFLAHTLVVGAPRVRGRKRGGACMIGGGKTPKEEKGIGLFYLAFPGERDNFSGGVRSNLRSSTHQRSPFPSEGPRFWGDSLLFEV